MPYSKFYKDNDLMDCIALPGGCDGSGCSHSDCSNYNYHLVDLLPHNAQETRYVHVVHATTCLCHMLLTVSSSEQRQIACQQSSNREMTQEVVYEETCNVSNVLFCMKNNIAYSTVTETSLK